MLFDALVLAGGPPAKTQAFGAGKGDRPKSLVPIAGRPMVKYVVDSLQHCHFIDRVAVAGPVGELEAALSGQDGVILVPGAESLTGTVRRGLQVLNSRGMVVIATADIPLVRSEMLNDFLECCTDPRVDFFYPIVRKEDTEAHYPGVRRTYARLREGTFTGGNVVLLRPELLEDCLEQAEMLTALRKSPLALARQVGWVVTVKFLLNRLGLREIESRLSALLGINVRAVIIPYPEIGIDVDKPSDLELAERVLTGRR